MFVSILSALSHFLHLILGIETSGGFPPPLSAAEEKQCFLAMEGGDQKAREKLILHNLRLVSHIVRKYYASAKNQDDLISIGNLGLIKAVDTFRVSNGARFATYAAKCIQNEILMHFRSQKKLAAEVSIHDTIDVDRDGKVTEEDVVLIAGDISWAMKLEDAIVDITTLSDLPGKKIMIRGTTL